MTSVQVTIHDLDNVPFVAREARRLAERAGMSKEEAECVVLAAREMATNLARYAPGGSVRMASLERDGTAGVELASWDNGPGIPDLNAALHDGFSTGGGLGGGLPGIRRLMDEFEIESTTEGTRIVARKWASAH